MPSRSYRLKNVYVCPRCKKMFFGYENRKSKYIKCPYCGYWALKSEAQVKKPLGEAMPQAIPSPEPAQYVVSHKRRRSSRPKKFSKKHPYIYKTGKCAGIAGQKLAQKSKYALKYEVAPKVKSGLIRAAPHVKYGLLRTGSGFKTGLSRTKPYLKEAGTATAKGLKRFGQLTISAFKRIK